MTIPLAITLAGCPPASQHPAPERPTHGPAPKQPIAAPEAPKGDQEIITLAKASQDPAAAAEARQIAEQRFAAGLYRLGLRAASRSLFAVIADNEKHAGRAEAFPWLARLASELPEAA